jgi:hypothetical protein
LSHNFHLDKTASYNDQVKTPSSCPKTTDYALWSSLDYNRISKRIWVDLAVVHTRFCEPLVLFIFLHFLILRSREAQHGVQSVCPPT